MHFIYILCRLPTRTYYYIRWFFVADGFPLFFLLSCLVDVCEARAVLFCCDVVFVIHCAHSHDAFFRSFRLVFVCVCALPLWMLVRRRRRQRQRERRSATLSVVSSSSVFSRRLGITSLPSSTRRQLPACTAHSLYCTLTSHTTQRTTMCFISLQNILLVWESRSIQWCTCDCSTSTRHRNVCVCVRMWNQTKRKINSKDSTEQPHTEDDKDIVGYWW